MSLDSRRPCQHEMSFSCVWVKRDMSFIFFFGVSVREAALLLFFRKFDSRCVVMLFFSIFLVCCRFAVDVERTHISCVDVDVMEPR